MAKRSWGCLNRAALYQRPTLPRIYDTTGLSMCTRHRGRQSRQKARITDRQKSAAREPVHIKKAHVPALSINKKGHMRIYFKYNVREAA